MEFVDINFDKKNIAKNEDNTINPFLLENSLKQAEEIYDFLSDSEKLLLVNGFKGTGKNALCSYVCKFLNNDVLKLNYKCFETTISDDILLSFFRQFKAYAQQNFIQIPNIKYENFAQKINAYFETVKTPILITISSFDDILKSNFEDIINFIRHITSYDNVKVIIISKKPDLNNFEIPYKKVTMLALEKAIFEKYLRAENFKQTGPLSDELYKHTRGYYFYVSLSIKIMKHYETGLFEFLGGFGKSLMTFNDYVLREALSLVDPVSGHLFRFLATIRHSVSKSLLEKLHLYDEEKIRFFTDYMLLSYDADCIYLKNYYREIAENSIPENVSIKLHQGCVDLYNTQLPLKPFERDIMISRQTMRNEIEYHEMFIPRKPIVEENIIVQTPEETQPQIQQEIPKQAEEQTFEAKEEQIQKMSFIFDDDDTGVLDTIANSIETYIHKKDEKLKQENTENSFSLNKLIITALNEERQYNYAHACALYTKALTRKNDSELQVRLAEIYEGLARNNQKISNWFEAENYYKSAYDAYIERNNVLKANEMLYNVANVLYNTFKKANAKEILQKLEHSDLQEEIRIKVNNLMSILNPDKAETYCKKSLELNLENIPKEVLSELYYRYGLICEDKDDINTAVKYYKKCIDLGQKNNPYLADCYSNIAQLYDDIGQPNDAVKYYLESFKTDGIYGNLNGMYTTSMRLAEIFSIKDYEKAELYYKKALQYAQKLSENFYIITASTALGDFYFNRKKYPYAIAHLKTALNIAKRSNYKENAYKIELRLQDIERFLGEERFREIEK